MMLSPCSPAGCRVLLLLLVVVVVVVVVVLLLNCTGLLHQFSIKKNLWRFLLR